MSHEKPTHPQAVEPDWWGDDGHLTDVALSVLADGQTDVVAKDVAPHLATCSQCQARSGEMVFLSAVADWAVAHPAGAVARNPAVAAVSRLSGAEAATVEAGLPTSGGPRSRAMVPRARFPYLGLLAALVIAALGSLPGATGWMKAGPLLAVQWRDALGVAVRMGGLLVRRTSELLGPTADVAPIVGAALLLLIGLGVARGLPRRKGDLA